MRRGSLPLAVVAAVVVTSTAVIVSTREPDGAEDASTLLVARVLDERGGPLADTELRLGADVEVRTDDDGDLRAPLSGGAQLVTLAAEGYLPRTQAVQPGEPTEFRLTSRAEETVSIRFGGDVMFGRRYYDADDDGDRSDGLLPEDASVADHVALLEHVRPLLEDADLTVVNLESPLSEQPWFDPGSPRPAGFSPGKDLVFASAPESVAALSAVGVDVVALGNNHVNDGLGDGLARTLSTLDAAGVARFGAGRTVDEAWAPAVIERRGQRLAFLGCTTVVGADQVVSNVVTDDHGGAATCTDERLRTEIRAARTRAEIVIVMIHGGTEYDPRPSTVAQQASDVATRAGADLVVNGHPHVVGETRLEGEQLVADSLGNLLFDQDVWPTFLSYLLRVDVRGDEPVLATVDPLFIEDYVPRPTVGLLADAAARRAAGTSGGDLRLRASGAVIAPGEAVESRRAQEIVDVTAVQRLGPAWWIAAPEASGGSMVRMGEDLLWTGSFEDMDTDPGTPGAHAWSLGRHARLAPEAACSGELGLELDRSGLSTVDVIATPEHRQLVRSGSMLSLVADVRNASAGASLELRWYSQVSGASTSVTSLPIPPRASGRGGCEQVRLDATVPDGSVAVQPFIRLAPPDDVHRGPRLAVDNVQLVVWAEDDFGRRYEVVDAREDTSLTLTDDSPMPGDAFPLAGAG